MSVDRVGVSRSQPQRTRTDPFATCDLTGGYPYCHPCVPPAGREGAADAADADVRDDTSSGSGSGSDGGSASESATESESGEGDESNTDTDGSDGSEQIRSQGGRGRGAAANAGRSPGPARRVQQLRGSGRGAQSRSMNAIGSGMDSLTSLSNDFGLLPFADSLPMVSKPNPNPDCLRYCATLPLHRCAAPSRSPTLTLTPYRIVYGVHVRVSIPITFPTRTRTTRTWAMAAAAATAATTAAAAVTVS